MSTYDKIYELAADQYGLITTEEAKDLGIPNIELTKLAHRGKLKRLGYGLYRITKYIPTALDIYAEAVKMVGSDACLYGESVLALYNLIPTNPSRIYVASSMRIRKRLPDHISVIKKRINNNRVYYEGIPTQDAANAIRSCIGTIMYERLINAVDEARGFGLITVDESKALIKELENV